MITTEQNKEITRYLVSKNLPIDLVLEVKDHMIEQIESMENVCFEESFEQVKISWKEELKMVFSFKSPLKKITAFQKRILNKIENEIFIKTIKLFLPFFITSIILTIYNKELSKNVIFIIYLIISLINAFSLIYFYKISRTINLIRKKRISVYQGSSQLFFVGGMYVFIFNLMNFDERFEKFSHSIQSIFNGDFSNISYFPILYTYIFIFGWLIGLFYFLIYRKSISELKQRISLKL